MVAARYSTAPAIARARIAPTGFVDDIAHWPQHCHPRPPGDAVAAGLPGDACPGCARTRLCTAQPAARHATHTAAHPAADHARTTAVDPDAGTGRCRAGTPSPVRRNRAALSRPGRGHGLAPVRRPAGAHHRTPADALTCCRRLRPAGIADRLRPRSGRRHPRRGLLPDHRSRAHRGGRRRPGRPVLRCAHAVAAGRGRRQRIRRRSRPARAADRGRAALWLARLHARFGPALPQRGPDQARARRDGAAQAQPLPLAPDRRPGLAHRNQAAPAPGRSGRLPHPRRRCRPRSGQRTAASLLRPLQPGADRRHRRLCRPAPHPGAAGDRRARPCHRRHSRLSAARGGRQADPGLQPARHPFQPVQRRRGHLRLPRRGVRRSGRAVPGAVDPHRRRRGGQGPVAGLAAGAGAHARTGHRRRGRAAGLVRAPAGDDPGRPRKEAGRLGRDPRGRAAAAGHGDVLARHRRRPGGSAAGARRGDVAGVGAVPGLPADRLARRAGRTAEAQHPGNLLCLRAGARRTGAVAPSPHPGPAGEHVDRRHPQFRRGRTQHLAAAGGGGRDRLDPGGGQGLRQLPAAAARPAAPLPQPRHRPCTHPVPGDRPGRPAGRCRRLAAGRGAGRAVQSVGLPDPLHPGRQPRRRRQRRYR